MLNRALLCSLVIAALAGLPQPAAAQTWSDAQLEAWTVILESWEAIEARDASWSDRFVHSSAAVWSMDYPMPRTRDEVKRWDGYNFPNEKIHLTEFSPAAIVVEGSTAVGHYYYSLATEDADGDRKTTHGRCTDILIRAEGTWKFISWNCTDQDDDD